MVNVVGVMAGHCWRGNDWPLWRGVAWCGKNAASAGQNSIARKKYFDGSSVINM